MKARTFQWLQAKGAFFVFTACLCLQGHAQTSSRPWRLLPADPVAGETFVLQARGSWPGTPVSVESHQVIVNGLDVTLRAILPKQGVYFAVGGPFLASQAAGPLPSGTFTANYQASEGEPSFSPTPLGTFVIAPAPAPVEPAYRSLSGMWFTPGEPGSGLNVIQGAGGNLFAAYMGYSQAGGRPRWWVAPGGRWVSPTQFRGVVYQSEGSPMSHGYATGALRVQGVGLLTLTFVNAAEVDVQLEMPSEANDPSFFSLRTLRTRMSNQPF